MGDYRYRLGTSLSLLARSAEEAAFSSHLEVTVVDWGSREPLASALPLSPAAARLTQFLELTPGLLTARYGDTRWRPAAAVNAGVRRSRGEFIFFTDSDCLWSANAIAALGRLLRGETPLPVPIAAILAYVRRYQVPWATVQRQPSVEEWRRLLPRLAAGAQPEAPSAACLGGFSAGQLMHRDLWHAVRGYDEALDRPWGWSDNDLVLRVTQEYAWLDVSGDGFAGFHMEHWPYAEARAGRDPSTVNPMVIRDSPAANGDGWGLAGVAIPVAHGTAVTAAAEAACAVPLSGVLAAPDWHVHQEAVDFVGQCKADGETPAVPLARLAAVSQLALTEHPRTLYWFGAIEPGVLFTIIKACPAIELFLINPWPPGVSDGLPLHPGALASLLGRARFKGWSRIVQGDPATALDRIDRSSLWLPPSGERDADRAPIELAWLGSDAPATLLPGVVARLAAGGVVLLAREALDGAALDALAACHRRVLDEAGLVALTRLP